MHIFQKPRFGTVLHWWLGDVGVGIETYICCLEEVIDRIWDTENVHIPQLLRGSEI